MGFPSLSNKDFKDFMSHQSGAAKATFADLRIPADETPSLVANANGVESETRLTPEMPCYTASYVCVTGDGFKTVTNRDTIAIFYSAATEEVCFSLLPMQRDKANRFKVVKLRLAGAGFDAVEAFMKQGAYPKQPALG